MNCDVIAINFNVSDKLKHCIDSIQKNSINSEFQIIIIDNNSRDKDVLGLFDLFPDVVFRQLDANLGFAKANNIGVKYSNSEFLCFLNPDTLLVEDFISPLIKYIESNSNIGACAPMLVYEDNSYQSSTGLKMGFIHEFLESSMFIELYRKYIKKKYTKSTVSGVPIKVGWVSGACMIIKRSVFQEIGGFTEDYFLNYEDIDLCRKLEDQGYSNYYFPQYKCIHLDHKSFESNYELLIYTRYQSRLIYAKRYYSAILSIIVRIMHIFGLLFRILLVFFFYKGKELKSRKSGYFKAFKLYLFNSD